VNTAETWLVMMIRAPVSVASMVLNGVVFLGGAGAVVTSVLVRVYGKRKETW
jgi:hypothetical protein